MYIYNICELYVLLDHFAVYLKLTQHCKSSILQKNLGKEPF